MIGWWRKWHPSFKLSLHGLWGNVSEMRYLIFLMLHTTLNSLPLNEGSLQNCYSRFLRSTRFSKSILQGLNWQNSKGILTLAWNALMKRLQLLLLTLLTLQLALCITHVQVLTSCLQCLLHRTWNSNYRSFLGELLDWREFRSIIAACTEGEAGTDVEKITCLEDAMNCQTAKDLVHLNRYGGSYYKVVQALQV